MRSSNYKRLDHSNVNKTKRKENKELSINKCLNHSSSQIPRLLERADPLPPPL